MIDADDLESFLPELIYHQDEPIADWVCVPLHYVSKLARDNGHGRRPDRRGLGRALPRLPVLHQRTRASARRYWHAVPARAAPCAGAAPAARPRVPHGRARRRARPGDRGGRRRADARSGAVRSPTRARSRSASSRTGARIPTRTTIVERFWQRGRARAARRRPAAEDDLPRAEEPARRAAADARRQDDDGELGRGARPVPRPSISSSSRSRCRPR